MPSRFGSSGSAPRASSSRTLSALAASTAASSAVPSGDPVPLALMSLPASGPTCGLRGTRACGWRAWGVGVGGGGRTQLLRDQVQPAPHRGLLQVARRLAKQRQQQQRQQRLARHVGATGWVGLGWGSKPLEGAGCGLERQPRSKGSSRGFSRRRQSAAAAGLTLTWSTWPLQLPSVPPSPFSDFSVRTPTTPTRDPLGSYLP